MLFPVFARVRIQEGVEWGYGTAGVWNWLFWALNFQISEPEIWRKSLFLRVSRPLRLWQVFSGLWKMAISYGTNLSAGQEWMSRMYSNWHEFPESIWRVWIQPLYQHRGRGHKSEYMFRKFLKILEGNYFCNCILWNEQGNCNSKTAMRINSTDTWKL